MAQISAVRVLSSQEAIIEAMAAAKHDTQQYYKAFYSSYLDGIITDPTYMTVPIDDHMVHRGHGTFDTCTVVNGKAYNLERHIRRIVDSCSKARIDLPKPAEDLKQIILNLVASTGLRDAKVRYWISAGPGNFGILPVAGASTFYGMVLPYDHAAQIEDDFQTTKSECFVDVPMKPNVLAEQKSVNYMINALGAIQAKEKGGFLGLQKFPDGTISEGAICNYGFIFEGGEFATPPFAGILTGTGMESVLRIAEKLKQQGLLTNVQQRPIHSDEVAGAKEMMVTCGDKIWGVSNFEGSPIGNGEIGEITKNIITEYHREIVEEELGYLINIPYENYAMLT